jgi:hypothetical protein
LGTRATFAHVRVPPAGATDPADAAANATLPRVTDAEIALGTGLASAALGVFVAVDLSGASHLQFVPALAVPLVAIACGPLPAKVEPWRPRLLVTAVTLFALLSVVVWAPIVMIVDRALGFAIPGALSAATASMLVPALALFPVAAPRGPRLRRSLFARIALAGAAVFAGVAAARPPFDPAHPQRVNVVYHLDAGRGGARAIIDNKWGGMTWGEVPAPMAQALSAVAEQPAARGPRFPWSPGVVLAARVAVVNLAPPEVVVVNDGAPDAGVARGASAPGFDAARRPRRVRVRVRSPRGARTVGLAFESDRCMVTIADDPAATPSREPEATWSFLGTPDDGIELVLACPSAPVRATILDRTPGVPPLLGHVTRARPPTAVMVQDGDVTVVSRDVTL